MILGTRSDDTKVLLGCPRSGPEVVDCLPIDSAVVAPGFAGSLNSEGEFVAGGKPHVGISRGQSMAHKNRTSVTLKGKKVPLRLTEVAAVSASLVKGDLTFTAKTAGPSGNLISVAFVAGGTAGSEVVTVVGTDISVSMGAEVSTATQLKTAIDNKAEAAALISVAIASGEGSTAQDAFAKDELEGGTVANPYVVAGAIVYVEDDTGLAKASGDGVSATSWKYSDGMTLEGFLPTGSTTAQCALVDM